MCYNCGCFNPQDDMGSGDNITESKQLEDLAKHWGQDLLATKKQLHQMLINNDPALTSDPFLAQMFDNAARAWGQSVEEAKKNTKELLKTEI